MKSRFMSLAKPDFVVDQWGLKSEFMDWF